MLIKVSVFSVINDSSRIEESEKAQRVPSYLPDCLMCVSASGI